jgi:hypothetical protein
MRAGAELRVMTSVSRRRSGFDMGQRTACLSLAAILGLLVGLKRDVGSATLDALHHDCVAVFRWLSEIDTAASGSPEAVAMSDRLAAICEGLDDVTATALPTVDDLQIRSAIEQLAQIAGFLSHAAPGQP